MEVPLFVSYSLEIASELKYLLIFLGVIVEGPIVMLASGFFLSFGVFSAIPLFMTLFIGDLAADILWYYIGCFFAEPLLNKHGRFFSITPELFEKVKFIMRKHQYLILIGSKVTLGFGLALVTVIVAGASRVPMRIYIFMNALGEVILVTALLGGGYFFGQLYTYIEDSFKAVFVAGGVIVFSLLAYGFSKYIRKKALKV